MDPIKAREWLRAHETDLAELEAKLKRTQDEVDATRQIVEGYRRLLGEMPASDESSPTPPTPRRRRNTQGPGLKRVLADLLGERVMLTIDEAMDALAEMSAYSNGNMPSRNTVGSRLSDLVREGKARSHGSGLYEWITESNGSGPSAARLEGLHDEVG